MRLISSAILLSIFSLTGLVTAAPIPFDPSRGLVEVEVTVDGRATGTFGIDTGADQLYIDRTFAEAADLTFRPLSGRTIIAGIEGTAQAMAVSLRSLAIGDDETLYNIAATAVDLHALGGGRSGSPDGLIGHDILRRFYVTVDYPNRTMELISSEPDFLRGKRYEEVPFREHGHLILVDVVIDEDVTAPMILDYCASYSTISPKLAERLDLVPDDSSPQTLSKVRIGEKVIAEDVKVAIVDHRNIRKSVPRAEFEGILGASFLYRYKITVDYKRDCIYIHK